MKVRSTVYTEGSSFITSDVPPTRITPAACAGHEADEYAANPPAPKTPPLSFQARAE